MKHISGSASFAVVVLAATGGLVASATVAEAAGGTAPSCVKRQVGSTGGMPNGAKVTVTNRCSGTQRVKIVFTHAHDSRCFTLKRGRSATAQSNIAYPFSHYDKTVTC